MRWKAGARKTSERKGERRRGGGRDREGGGGLA